MHFRFKNLTFKYATFISPLHCKITDIKSVMQKYNYLMSCTKSCPIRYLVENSEFPSYHSVCKEAKNECHVDIHVV